LREREREHVDGRHIRDRHTRVDDPKTHQNMLTRNHRHSDKGILVHAIS
jgi:hypothetical protein